MRPFDHAWLVLKTGERPIMEGFTAERDNPSIEQIRAHAEKAGFEPNQHSFLSSRTPPGYHAGGGYRGVKEQMMAEETPDYEKFPNYQSVMQGLGNEPRSSSMADYLTQRSELTHPTPPM
ncbi:hypothetical protein OAA43_00320 [bacterium]|nr:hypothetical protein [bacterium]